MSRCALRETPPGREDGSIGEKPPGEPAPGVGKDAHLGRREDACSFQSAEK